MAPEEVCQQTSLVVFKEFSVVIPVKMYINTAPPNPKATDSLEGKLIWDGSHSYLKKGSVSV